MNRGYMGLSPLLDEILGLCGAVGLCFRAGAVPRGIEGVVWWWVRIHSGCVLGWRLG